MPTVLKGRKVFLDTNVFESASFDMTSPDFSEFSKLCVEGKFELLTTDITRRELVMRIGELVGQARIAVSPLPKGVLAEKLDEPALIKGVRHNRQLFPKM